jgi:rhomboid protease GluP
MGGVDEMTAQPQVQAEQDFLLRLDAATPRVVVTPALLAINIAVFLAMVALGVDVLGARAEEYLRFGANFAPLTTGGEWWRLLTCTFMHLGVLHLALNLWALWDSGRLTERLFGNGWFAALYLFSGIAGSSASMLWNHQAISAGASGAVFGVYGALLAYLTVQRGAIPAEALNRLRVSASIFVTYSLFYGFAQAGIDNAAHLGGLAGGFAMGLILARPLEPHLRGSGSARRAVLAAALAAVTLPTAAWLTPDTSRVYRQAIALQNETAAFNADLARLLAAFQDIVTRSQTGQISDADVVKALRATMLPEWDAAVVRLARVELDTNAPTRKNYELLLRYAVARRDMIKAVADYLETGNPAYERRVGELRAQADDALNQYQQLQRH